MFYSTSEFNNDSSSDVSDWEDLTRYDEELNLTMADTPLLANIKGCGYPPDTNCKAFTNKYEELHKQGTTFPCYYRYLCIPVDGERWTP